MGIWADKSQPIEPEALELAEGGTSLTLLQGVYRSAALPLPTRIRAAAMALPFEHPKLAVTAIIADGDFADRLDRAIARANGTTPQMIDHAPQRELPPTGPKPTPMSAPFPMERHRRA